jgi:DNA-binding MarR family transcriptional regulator
MSAGDGYPLDGISNYPAAEIAAAWRRERPGTPTSSIEVVTPLWRLAKVLADDRRRVLRTLGVDPSTLDLLSVLRRSGKPYELTTREISARALVSAGAISQRLARAERAGLVQRRPSDQHRQAVIVRLTKAGHRLIERTVDEVLGREASLLGGLSAGERDALSGLLQRLAESVQSRL